jgi:hypothetical protein
MRAHGRPAFPDPVVSAQGVRFRRSASVGPSSSQFQSAQQACRKLFPRGAVVMSSTVSWAGN